MHGKSLILVGLMCISTSLGGSISLRTLKKEMSDIRRLATVSCDITKVQIDTKVNNMSPTLWTLVDGAQMNVADPIGPGKSYFLYEVCKIKSYGFYPSFRSSYVLFRI